MLAHTVNKSNLPTLGDPLRFEDFALDKGYIDNFARTGKLGYFIPIDPAFFRLLLKNKVRGLWVYHRVGRWNVHRYVVTVERLLRCLAVCANMGYPWLMEDEDGNEWILIPCQILERRRFTKYGGRLL